MGFRLDGIVGAQSLNDGNQQGALVRLARDGSLVVTDRSSEELMRGNVYIATSATAGIAIIAPAAGGGHPTLWNPSGSGVNLDIMKLSLSYVSGNNAPTSIAWCITANTGATVATAAPIATWTQVAVVNALAGGAVSGKSQWSPTTQTFTAAPTYWAPTGLSLFTGVAATAVAPFSFGMDYFGSLGIGQSNALSLCTQAATTTALFRVCIHYAEKVA